MVIRPKAVQILTESLAMSLRCGWCLLDLTRVKSGRACLPRQARQPRQPSRRAPIYQQSECENALACRLAASSNRVGRSPTGGPRIRPSDPRRRVNVGKLFCVKPANVTGQSPSIFARWFWRQADFLPSNGVSGTEQCRNQKPFQVKRLWTEVPRPDMLREPAGCWRKISTL